MSAVKKFLKFLYRKTEVYFSKSSIQGLVYITQPKRHFSERIFWVAICLAALYGTHKLLNASWYNFQNNAISFATETSYLRWNTTFAAISVCEVYSTTKLYGIGKRLYGADRDISIDMYLREIAFFKGTCDTCESNCGNEINCTDDFQYILNTVKSKCNDLIHKCTWNGKPFDCCSQFLPLQTELGTCYTINSLHTKAIGKKEMLISNRQTGPGRLDFYVNESSMLYIHGPEDVPYSNQPSEEVASLNEETEFTMVYQVNEIVNDPELKYISVRQRDCRFPDENILDVYRYYSYSTCIVQCKANAQIAYCNCTHHFIPSIAGVKTCDIDGLKCLTENADILTSLTAVGLEKKGLICDCPPSCVEPEYTVIYRTEDDLEEDDPLKTKVGIVMATLPSERYKRNVVRTRLDLVVSMGATIGLFMGASLLSLVELFFFIFLRNRRILNEGAVDNSGSSSTVKHVKSLTKHFTGQRRGETVERSINKDTVLRYYQFLP